MIIRNSLGQIDDIEEFDYDYWLNLDELDHYQDYKEHNVRFPHHEYSKAGDIVISYIK